MWVSLKIIMVLFEGSLYCHYQHGVFFVSQDSKDHRWSIYTLIYPADCFTSPSGWQMTGRKVLKALCHISQLKNDPSYSETLHAPYSICKNFSPPSFVFLSLRLLAFQT